MALFESYERRIAQINSFLNANGIASIEEAEQLCRNIAIIDHGRIIENTSMKSLLSKLDVETFVLDLAATPNALPDVPGVRLSMADAVTLDTSALDRDAAIAAAIHLVEDLGARHGR